VRFLYQFIQLLCKLYSTNSYTVWFLYQFIQIFIRIIVRIHTRCDFFILFLVCLRKPWGINYLAIPKDPLAFLYEFVSRIGIKKFNQQKHVRKKWTPPSSQVCGNMYNYVLKNSIHHPQKWIIRFDSNGISLSGNFHYSEY
jgi:hypothetical protein